MGILDGNPIPFNEEPHVMIDEAYLVQGHTLKKGPDDSLIFFSLGYANEIPLPNAGYHLYNCRSLTIPLVPPSPKKTNLRKLLDSRPTKRDPPTDKNRELLAGKNTTIEICN